MVRACKLARRGQASSEGRHDALDWVVATLAQMLRVLGESCVFEFFRVGGLRRLLNIVRVRPNTVAGSRAMQSLLLLMEQYKGFKVPPLPGSPKSPKQAAHPRGRVRVRVVLRGRAPRTAESPPRVHMTHTSGIRGDNVVGASAPC